MAKEPNRECLICGKGYYCCRDCEEAKSFTSWRKTACSIECFNTYLDFLKYEKGELSKEDFKDRLVRNSMNEKEILTSFKVVIDDVMACEPRKVEEAVTEGEIESEVVEVAEAPITKAVKHMGRKK